MKFKYTIKCFQSDKSLKKFPNNFAKEISLFKKNPNIFIVRIELKHRYFEIDGFSSSDNSQGIIFSYTLKPHLEKKQKEYTMMIEILNFPLEQYNMVIDRNKESLELIFIKKSKETLLEYKKLRPKE